MYIVHWLRRTLLAPEYQPLTESSDLRVTFFCPGLSRNADLGNFANQCVLFILLFQFGYIRCHFILKNILN